METTHLPCTKLWFVINLLTLFNYKFSPDIINCYQLLLKIVRRHNKSIYFIKNNNFYRIVKIISHFKKNATIRRRDEQKLYVCTNFSLSHTHTHTEEENL